MRKIISTTKLENSSTDHLPVVTKIWTNSKLDKSKFKRKITKRSMRNFTEEKWNSCLSKKNWMKIEECDDVNEMVSVFSEFINEALDEIALVKTFTIKSN